MSKAKNQGKTKAVLFGGSYVKFLLEYACEKSGLPLEERESFTGAETDALLIAGENCNEEETATLKAAGAVSIVDAVCQTR